MIYTQTFHYTKFSCIIKHVKQNVSSHNLVTDKSIILDWVAIFWAQNGLFLSLFLSLGTFKWNSFIYSVWAINWAWGQSGWISSIFAFIKPISSHFDWTGLVNKEYFHTVKEHYFLVRHCGLLREGKIAYFGTLSCQSQCRISFNLPAHRA